MFLILNMLQPIALKRLAIYLSALNFQVIKVFSVNHIDTTEFKDSLILTNSPSYIGCL